VRVGTTAGREGRFIGWQKERQGKEGEGGRDNGHGREAEQNIL